MLAIRSIVARKHFATTAGWRTIVAGVALLAFALQSYLTQTHIHLTPALTASTQIAGEKDAADKNFASKRAAPKQKAPANDDPLKCPTCQAMGYAGHFVSPAAAMLLLPGIAVSILPLVVPPLSPRASPSHNWQGRGPPTS
ncbi:MAG: hypothetical protein JO056_01230 [Alphaproteobacteria bacterium]|nr:hypothetical protein [Alphaproteobacteria bacterium]